jgi:hypothetical protein
MGERHVKALWTWLTSCWHLGYWKTLTNEHDMALQECGYCGKRRFVSMDTH